MAEVAAILLCIDGTQPLYRIGLFDHSSDNASYCGRSKKLKLIMDDDRTSHGKHPSVPMNTASSRFDDDYLNNVPWEVFFNFTFYLFSILSLSFRKASSSKE